MFGLIVLLVLALVPVAAAEDELGNVFGATSWLAECGAITQGTPFPMGMAGVDNTIRIPPEFTVVLTYYAYSAQYGTIEQDDSWGYTRFVDDFGSWYFLVPADGYSTLAIEVFDSGGGLHTTSSVTADCIIGEIHVAQGSVYGPKPPKNFELRSLSGSSAVLDAPGGKQVGDNAVYAGQSWYVNPTPVLGPDGKNYTEIFVGGWKLGYIPTECLG
jgi:hypothetical protein